MEAVFEAQQKFDHVADHRTRELYRYCQATTSIGDAFSSLSSNGGSPWSNSVGTGPITPSVDGVGNSNGSRISQFTTAVAQDTLILGTSNSVLTSFAQLAALRLNVERAFICVLDRDKQFILSEATKSANLNDIPIRGHVNDAGLALTNNHKPWKLCEVGHIQPG